MDGWVDGWMDGWMDAVSYTNMNEWMDGWRGRGMERGSKLHLLVERKTQMLLFHVDKLDIRR